MVDEFGLAFRKLKLIEPFDKSESNYFPQFNHCPEVLQQVAKLSTY